MIPYGLFRPPKSCLYQLNLVLVKADKGEALVMEEVRYDEKMTQFHASAGAQKIRSTFTAHNIAVRAAIENFKRLITKTPQRGSIYTDPLFKLARFLLDFINNSIELATILKDFLGGFQTNLARHLESIFQRPWARTLPLMIKMLENAEILKEQIDEFQILTHQCVKHNVYVFKNKTYKFPYGAPLLALIAHIFLDFLKTSVLRNSPNSSYI